MIVEQRQSGCQLPSQSIWAVSRPVGWYHLHPPLLIYTQNTTHPLDVKKISDVERDSLSANRRVIVDSTVIFDVRANSKRHRPQLQTMYNSAGWPRNKFAPPFHSYDAYDTNTM